MKNYELLVEEMKKEWMSEFDDKEKALEDWNQQLNEGYFDEWIAEMSECEDEMEESTEEEEVDELISDEGINECYKGLKNYAIKKNDEEKNEQYFTYRDLNITPVDEILFKCINSLGNGEYMDIDQEAQRMIKRLFMQEQEDVNRELFKGLVKLFNKEYRYLTRVFEEKTRLCYYLENEEAYMRLFELRKKTEEFESDEKYNQLMEQIDNEETNLKYDIRKFYIDTQEEDVECGGEYLLRGLKAKKEKCIQEYNYYKGLLDMANSK